MVQMPSSSSFATVAAWPWLSFEVIQAPNYGGLSGVPPDLLFTPKPDFNGSDAFIFLVRDSRGLALAQFRGDPSSQLRRPQRRAAGPALHAQARLQWFRCLHLPRSRQSRPGLGSVSR